MRDKMPETAALIDALREAFGAEAINAVLRRGMKGDANYFCARENGHQVGAAFTWAPGIRADAMQIDRPTPEPAQPRKRGRA